MVDFYKILELDVDESESFIVKIALNKESDIFKGHFPSQPVTPGATLVQIIKEVAAKVLNKEIRFSYVKDVKFNNPIDPLLDNIVFITGEISLVDSITR